MRKIKNLLGVCALLCAGLFMIASDHMETPALDGASSDVTDHYVFEARNPHNLVFATTIQGFMSPEATKSASFDENVLLEVNIDNDGDNIEDLVIQAIPRDGVMYFFGPVEPTATGTTSVIETDGIISKVRISKGRRAVIGRNRGMKFFAGPRDDPFFFDAGQFMAIFSGEATGFNDPGVDTFAGTNALGVVIEVPKSMLGGSGILNTWIESKILEGDSF